MRPGFNSFSARIEKGTIWILCYNLEDTNEVVNMGVDNPPFKKPTEAVGIWNRIHKTKK